MRPSWDETWLEVAAVVAKRAACTRAQVGALVVIDNKRIFSGYNGAPPGQLHCTEGGCPRGKLSFDDCAPNSSYDNCVALHAEQNALLRAGDRAVGATLYLTREPCPWCWKNIQAAQIARVVWIENGCITDRSMV